MPEPTQQTSAKASIPDTVPQPNFPPELIDRIRRARDMKPGVCELLKKCEECGVNVAEHLAICDAVDKRLEAVQRNFLPSGEE